MPSKPSYSPLDEPNIWNRLPRPFLILAPMEGVTDAIFRQVVARAGRPDLFYTEFTNVSSFASEKGRSNALERLEVVPSDKPIIAQIWGKNPAHFAELAAALAELGFSGIDLNFGCPDRHVNAAGGGAAMIRTPELAVECINAVKSATSEPTAVIAASQSRQTAHHSLPLSIKTRLGYSRVDEYRDWLTLLLEQRPAALTVHLRTKKEMSKVPAHYELIPEILRLRDTIAPDTKLIINGDIKDRLAADALHAQHPAIDGFMIGRGVFTNPYCFRQPIPASAADAPFTASQTPAANTSSEPNTSPDSPHRLIQPTPTPAESLALLRYHLQLFQQASERRRLSFEPLKHYFKIYLRDFPGAADLRAALMDCHSVEQANQILTTTQPIVAETY